MNCDSRDKISIEPSPGGQAASGRGAGGSYAQCWGSRRGRLGAPIGADLLAAYCVRRRGTDGIIEPPPCSDTVQEIASHVLHL